MAKVKINNKWGFINKSGKEIIPVKYNSIYDFSDGLALAIINDKWGFIDKTGKEIIPLKYDRALLYFTEGLTGVAIKDKWGFIDKAGKVIIPFKYDSVFNFKDGKSDVRINDERFSINKKGERVK